MGQEEVEHLMAQSLQAAANWSETYKERRGFLLEGIKKGLSIRKEAIATIITKEVGKPIAQSRAEVDKCILLCDTFLEMQDEFFQDNSPIKHKRLRAEIVFQPLGLILGIMPWNFPLWQAMRFALPTILGGNVVLLKHAPNVPQSALMVDQVFKDAIDERVCQNIFIDIEGVANLIADKRVRGVSLTGSVRAGRSVGELAGRCLKPSVLELGGADPFIVLEDADLELAAKIGAASRLNNAGQTCISAKRFIIHQKVYDEFKSLLMQEMSAFEPSDPMLENCRLGPMARMDLLGTLEAQVADSLQKGAKVVLDGGKTGALANFFSPMILEDVMPNQRAWGEELFGPVATLFKVRDIAEAIKLANDSEYGLGAAIWSSNKASAEFLSQRLEVGNVAWNNLVSSDPLVPFGGVKNSGYGRELAMSGLRAFSNQKAIRWG